MGPNKRQRAVSGTGRGVSVEFVYAGVMVVLTAVYGEV